MPVNKLNLLTFEVLEKASKARSKEKKIKILQENETWALKDILIGTYSEEIEFNLPPGEPPYRASQPHNAPTNLQRKNTEFRYFTKGGPGDKMSALKREGLFIGLLESVHPEDAKLVINMINKVKIQGITKNVVMEAFPGLPIS
tara:strand:+ start:115 stop:546 length:432 start_codon:yes stop_codon:yes gene_type:complete